MKTTKPSIAIIGSGISGLGAANAIAAWANVTVLEKDARAGGHSHAVDVSIDNLTHPVDTGFLVFNDRTYPHLIELFENLQVPIAQSNMSFAISLGPYKYEWCGSDDLSRVLAQPSNLFKPRFWFMLRDMVRFNKAASAIAQATANATANTTLPTQTLQQYLDSNNYSRAFRNDYLLPMAAAIWSCPINQILQFPLPTFIRFCDNHGLLQVNNRPKWKTVAGSSREYVKRLIANIEKNGSQLRLSQPVTQVQNQNGKVVVTVNGQSQIFDGVLMAGHSDQNLSMLAQPTLLEQSVLGAIRYQPNRAVLHTDKKLMPKRTRAWAAWNYMGLGSATESEALSVTYWLNTLQPLPFKKDVFVTLNPVIEPDPALVHREFSYAHPVFDGAAIAAQKKLPNIQGQRQIWYAGAWTGYGFHEDGLRSGLEAAELMKQHFVQQSESLQQAA